MINKWADVRIPGIVKWPKIILTAFYFMRYQHSMADIIVFQFWLLGLHEHLITNTKAARRSPQVVSACNFLMSSRVLAGLRYPFCSVIVHATMREPPLVSGERGLHGLQGQRAWLWKSSRNFDDSYWMINFELDWIEMLASYWLSNDNFIMIMFVA